MSILGLFGLVLTVSSVAAAPGYGSFNKPPPSGCAYDKCLYSKSIPDAWKPVASTFCQILLRTKVKPVTVSTTVTVSSVTTITPASVTATTTSPLTIPTTTTITNRVTVSITATAVSSVSCSGSSTVTIAAPTFVNYISRSMPPAAVPSKRDAQLYDVEQNDAYKLKHDKRDSVYGMPTFFTNGCRSPPPFVKIKNACSCFLTASTTTITQTSTATVSVTAAAMTNTVTATEVVVTTQTATVAETDTDTTTVTSTTCTQTINPTVNKFVCGGFSAVPSSSTSAAVTCTNTATSPSLVARHRIEGADTEGTIYEDCILSGPRSITTNSGGTHVCDGTNNNGGSSPGTAITGQTDAAAQLAGFTYDGSYSNAFQDYFITRIGDSVSTSNQFWGVLRNGQFTPAGGCQSRVSAGDKTLWAFDAFTKNAFLSVAPDYVAARAGQGTITVTVSNTDNGNVVGGASFAGGTSGGDGKVTFNVPSVPGCYQYKATRSDAIRSNAVYVAVYDAFA
ncbi:hypothetical protein CAC42_4351 [Sphaceloma murrayae]|uniref:Uncharacterized protein n=1 Tax=Sphaceloma murrayae TaxID=2082308 RepID=A0A2K1QM51_9PEZI|nr:hypothetical protein CAC42_4351 [Sphaceloma murrayae]